AEELAEFALVKQHRDRYCVKEQEMEGTLGEKSETKKNPWHRPGEPAGPPFAPPSQPENEGESKERDVEYFDLDEAAFLDRAEIREPDERGAERCVGAERRARHGKKGQGDQ